MKKFAAENLCLSLKNCSAGRIFVLNHITIMVSEYGLVNFWMLYKPLDIDLFLSASFHISITKGGGWLVKCLV